MQIFGLDIGGSGIKGAPVDLDKGDLAQERHKVLTPHPATPDSVADGARQVVEHFGWDGIPEHHAARHGFPLAPFQLRFAEWWQSLLRRFEAVAREA